MTMLRPALSAQGRGQLLGARHCLLATSLGTIPGARAKSFSDARNLTRTPYPPPCYYACLRALKGKLQSVLFKESTRLKHLKNMYSVWGFLFLQPCHPCTDLPAPSSGGTRMAWGLRPRVSRLEPQLAFLPGAPPCLDPACEYCSPSYVYRTQLFCSLS